MLKGLALTPPVVGRISIGKVIESGGKRLPQKDDEFTITTQIRGQNGWLSHPIDETLRKSANCKLRTIPVRLVFDDPDLNLRASYTVFDRGTGRPVCVGDGETCRRVIGGALQGMGCPGPDACDFGQERGCKPYGRLNVHIGEEDELGTFIFRTTGFNSIRTLAARLRYFWAASGGFLAGLPLELRLRGKSTTQSHGTPVFYVDLTVRCGTTLCDAIKAAKGVREQSAAAGFDQQGLDKAAREGMANGAFEESAEEGGAVVEEFFPDAAEARSESEPREIAPGVAEKLRRKVSPPESATAGERHATSKA